MLGFRKELAMGTSTALFILLLLLSLVVATTFGVWAGYNPSSLSATAYVEQQHNAIRSLNALLPAMGAACILLLAGWHYQAKGCAHAILLDRGDCLPDNRCLGHALRQPRR